MHANRPLPIPGPIRCQAAVSCPIRSACQRLESFRQLWTFVPVASGATLSLELIEATCAPAQSFDVSLLTRVSRASPCAAPSLGTTDEVARLVICSSIQAGGHGYQCSARCSSALRTCVSDSRGEPSLLACMCARDVQNGCCLRRAFHIPNAGAKKRPNPAQRGGGIHAAKSRTNGPDRPI